MTPTPPPPERLGRLWAASAAMRATLARIREVAASETTVVIQGETGTGKELVAEALHEGSTRARGPLVVVDCASLPRELVESELFGHARGAFTGAVDARKGAFESAHGGTLFIDEVGELPLDLQPRLLRALEQREVRPVGASQVVRVDCRVVAATNRDLAREVRAGRFREDLYYRLAVVVIALPPLRERPEDVRFLARRFVDELAFEPLDVPEATFVQLLAHRWPGNVRELRNTIERAAALSDGVLRLPEDFGQDADLHDPPGADPGSGVGLGGPLEAPPADRVAAPSWAGQTYKEARARVLEAFERAYLAELLGRHGHNVSAAAREAGIHRNVLHRMIARLGLGRS